MLLVDQIHSQSACPSIPNLPCPSRRTHISRCRIAHDCTIPAVLQSTSLRLLYNLIETIFQRRADIRTSEAYRGLLSSILECFVRKLGTLRTQVPHVVR